MSLGQDGSPPLHSAISGNHQDIAKLLIEQYKASPTDGATEVRKLCMGAVCKVVLPH